MVFQGRSTLSHFLRFILLVGITYIIFRVYVYLSRSSTMKKVAKVIQERHAELQTLLDNDIQSAKEDLRYWKLGSKDKVRRQHASEEELVEAFKNAVEEKHREIKFYEKYVRLRERVFYDRKKLAEVFVAYERYLHLRIKYITDASYYVQMIDVGSMTFEEFKSTTDESRIAIQESERKLDVLLGENPTVPSS